MRKTNYIYRRIGLILRHLQKNNWSCKTQISNEDEERQKRRLREEYVKCHALIQKLFIFWSGGTCFSITRSCFTRLKTRSLTVWHHVWVSATTWDNEWMAPSFPQMRATGRVQALFILKKRMFWLYITVNVLSEKLWKLFLRTSKTVTFLFKILKYKGIWKQDNWGQYLGPRKMRMRSREGSTMRNFIICSFTLYSQGD